MPSNPKKKKCRNCKGEGYVYPLTEQACWRCAQNYFDPEKQKNCGYCEGKGYVMRNECLLCCHCDGGWVYE